MKRTTMTISAVIIFASLFVFGLSFAGEHEISGAQASDTNSGDCRTNCSLHSLKGCYGFDFSGDLINVGPIHGVGMTNFDGHGNLTTTQTVNVNGSGGIPMTGTGTYTVNSDCTGSLVSSFSDGSVIHLNLVIVNNGKGILGIATDPGGSTSGHYEKQ